MLRLSGVTGGYGRLQVLRGIDMRVDEGETICILGPNGCGKSTLLKTVIGLQSAWDGEVVLDGADVTHLGPPGLLRRGVAMVPAGGRVVAGLSVRENLLLGAYGRHGSRGRHEYRRRLESMLELLPSLESRLDVRAGALSGGEQQVVAVARALMAEPSLLLLDEPTLGLAPVASARLFDLLRGLREELAVTMVLVEQNTGFALEFSSRGYVLDQGKVALEGPTNVLADDERVRDVFLGERGDDSSGQEMA